MREHKAICIDTLLARIPLFAGLGPEELQQIAGKTKQIHAPKGTTLFHRGDPSSGFHVVVYGQVKLGFLSAQGGEKVVEIVAQGQSFGEAIMLIDKPYVVSAQTLSDTLLLHIAKEVIFEKLDADPHFGKKLLAGMAMRTHKLLSDVEGYSLHSGSQRVIGYLLREMGEHPVGATGVEFELGINKGVIASRLNLTQEHFSRILRELIDLGLIRVDGRRIHIPSVANLTRLSA